MGEIPPHHILNGRFTALFGRFPQLKPASPGTVGRKPDQGYRGLRGASTQALASFLHIVRATEGGELVLMRDRG